MLLNNSNALAEFQAFIKTGLLGTIQFGMLAGEVEDFLGEPDSIDYPLSSGPTPAEFDEVEIITPYDIDIDAGSSNLKQSNELPRGPEHSERETNSSFGKSENNNTSVLVWHYGNLRTVFVENVCEAISIDFRYKWQGIPDSLKADWIQGLNRLRINRFLQILHTSGVQCKQLLIEDYNAPVSAAHFITTIPGIEAIFGFFNSDTLDVITYSNMASETANYIECPDYFT